MHISRTGGVALFASILATSMIPAVLHAKQSTAGTVDDLQRQCGVTSPLLNTLGDEYYVLDGKATAASRTRIEISINSNQSELLSSLVSARFTRGYGQRTRCFGAGDNIRAQSLLIELENLENREEQSGQHARDTDAANVIVLKALEYSREDRVLRPQSITVPLNEYELQLHSENQLSSNSRFRQSLNRSSSTSLIAGNGSLLKELALIATQTDGGITLEQSLYINGILAEWVTWHLSE